MSKVDIEEALEYAGYGKYNFLLILVCGLTLFAVNTEAYSIGYILPSAECDLQLDITRKGILSSSNFIGVMGSSLIWGYLSDTKGRKNILLTSFLLAFVSSVIAAFTPSFWGFTILRFFNGIFISGPSAITFAYFCEFHSLKHKSRSMACVSLFIAMALIFLPALGWLLLPHEIKWTLLGLRLNSWRLFMLICAIPNIIVAFAYMKLHESPKYLYHSGRLEESLAVVRKIYSVNTGKPEDSFPIESLEDKIRILDEKSKSMISHLREQITPLFLNPHLKYTLSGALIQGGIFAVSSGLLLWYPDIINQLSSSSRSGMTVCEALSLSKNETGGCILEMDGEVFLQNIIIGSVYLIGYVLWGFLVNLLGNRNFFVLCMALSSAALLSLPFITHKIMIDIFFIVLLVAPGICVAVTNTAVVEIIPTHLCGMVVCIIMTAGRLGSVVSSSVVGIMLQWNCSVTFWTYGLSLIGCLLLAFVFPKKAGS